MSNIIIGTSGHVDHGKTSLIRALTGINTDRLASEQKQNISIVSGFAYLTINNQDIGIIDVPGHEKFIKNMLTAAHGIDFIMLIIAADDGIMPQTTEHLHLMNLLGLQKGMVVLTKVDLVDQDTLIERQLEIEELCKGTFLENPEIILTSINDENSILNLKNYLENIVINTKPQKIAKQYFRMNIDRAFILEGIGQIITGTSEGKALHVDEQLQIFPSKQIVNVKQIQSHNKVLEVIESNKRCALNIKSNEKIHVKKGDIITTPNTFELTSRIEVETTMLEEIKNHERVKIYLGSSEVIARIKFSKSSAHLILEKPLITMIGDLGIIRKLSPKKTIGGFKVLNAYASRTTTRESVEIESLIEVEAQDFITISDLQKKLVHLNLEEIPHVFSINNKVIYQKNLALILDNIKNIFQNELMHNNLLINIPVQVLLQKLNLNLNIKEFTQLLQHFPELKVITGNVSLIGMQTKLTDEQVHIKNMLINNYKQAKYTPQNISDVKKRIANKSELEKVLNFLIQKQNLVHIENEIYLLDTHYKNLQNFLKNLYQEKQEIALPDVKVYCDCSRKYLVAYLEHFDKINLTQRQGNIRIIKNS